MHIDGPPGHRIIISMNRLDDLVAGERPARPAGQEVEEVKFHHCQLQRTPRQQGFMPSGIDQQLLNLQGRGLIHGPGGSAPLVAQASRLCGAG